jgi:hypothetical protein
MAVRQDESGAGRGGFADSAVDPEDPRNEVTCQYFARRALRNEATATHNDKTVGIGGGEVEIVFLDIMTTSARA